MSSSSEGRPLAPVVVVVAAAAVTDADALLRSLLSRTATLFQGVADPEDSPLVLFPVVGKPSIIRKPSTGKGTPDDGRSFFFSLLGVSKEWKKKSPPFFLLPPRERARARLSCPERHAGREEVPRPLLRAGSKVRRAGGPSRGESVLFSFEFVGNRQSKKEKNSFFFFFRFLVQPPRLLL